MLRAPWHAVPAAWNIFSPSHSKIYSDKDHIFVSHSDQRDNDVTGEHLLHF